MSCNGRQDDCTDAMSRLTVQTLQSKRPRSKGETRGQKTSGLTHECGVFGCIAAGDWPSQVDVAQVICLGENFSNYDKKRNSSSITTMN